MHCTNDCWYRLFSSSGVGSWRVRSATASVTAAPYRSSSAAVSSPGTTTKPSRANAVTVASSSSRAVVDVIAVQSRRPPRSVSCATRSYRRQYDSAIGRCRNRFDAKEWRATRPRSFPSVPSGYLSCTHTEERRDVDRREDHQGSGPDLQGRPRGFRQGGPEAVLDVAEQGEDHAKSEYEKALDADITAGLRTVVARQYTEVQQTHDIVRDLRDAYATA